ncbi:putative receptor-like protein kinase [Hibiscus syriacus]|uniref:Receptor-like protein kinase n=1 Tax=Hibiscus syriacus TaxID=106335 RepID=A0A6A3B1L6_HIBSY|nr:putative receptor-like protein kinase [Hibiscus syriacus]
MFIPLNLCSVAVIKYRLLEDATNGFHESNVLGEGGRGRAYKACFDEKFLAVVKKVDDVGVEAEREFENEVDWLVKIRHQNIVSLLGCCIHRPSHGSALTCNLRMKIAVDVARALEYLHENCNPPVVHRDIKSSNILLVPAYKFGTCNCDSLNLILHVPFFATRLIK